VAIATPLLLLIVMVFIYLLGDSVGASSESLLGEDPKELQALTSIERRLASELREVSHDDIDLAKNLSA
jgi:hypothetical protein